VVATAIDPAHHHNMLAGVGGAKFTAEMRTFQIALKIEHS
jgi:hypothetical protein